MAASKGGRELPERCRWRPWSQIAGGSIKGKLNEMID